jgi:hypothetical protein
MIYNCSTRPCAQDLVVVDPLHKPPDRQVVVVPPRRRRVELNNNSAYSAMPIKRLAGVGARPLCANFANSTSPLKHSTQKPVLQFRLPP